MAKSRVAPDKHLSIPRLELQAALLSTRLISSVAQELDTECTKWYLWSDSRTMLHWIHGEPRIRQVFVAHRLGEIGELTEKATWRWVPSKLNPVDCATRGECEGAEARALWLEGPPFLKDIEEHWPKPEPLLGAQKREIDVMEIRRQQHVYAAVSQNQYLPITVSYSVSTHHRWLLGW
ncbi:uncharacterized protein LOC106645140 [Copidosoma floridanum]|uniref:uncharacterized protein LOC106645140 n=1 Tax=Copidosoma floridanum TaxID=29053 RepID=UPI0006C95994|nr:uncharacterized protein LOC106645140 [Copidosoma floridanum]